MSRDDLRIVACETDGDYHDAMSITRAYVDSLGVDLGYQDIASEWQDFPRMYGPPKGVYLLAWFQGKLAGGVGLRDLGDGVSEMKRLYVYDDYQGKGIARQLCEALFTRAAELGYLSMRLDTLGNMHAAQALYEKLGFVDISAYRYNPDPLTRYMEKVFSGEPAD